jgi:hypothetical protein
MDAGIEFEYSSSGLCSICAGPLAEDGLVHCPRCKARYHSDCWEYNRSRCAVYGCAPRGEPQVQESRPAAGGTLPQCAYHPLNERILDCRGCGRSICSLCDIVVRGRHYCPPCYEMFLPAAERGPARTAMPPRPHPSDRNLCAFHQRNLRVLWCGRCQAPICGLCEFPLGLEHVCPTCYEIARMNQEPWGR